MNANLVVRNNNLNLHRIKVFLLCFARIRRKNARDRCNRRENVRKLGVQKNIERLNIQFAAFLTLNLHAELAFVPSRISTARNFFVIASEFEGVL